jgi:hypothetical protein
MEYDRAIVLPPLGSVLDYFLDVCEEAVWGVEANTIVHKKEFGTIFPKYVPKVVESKGISADNFFDEGMKVKKPFGSADEEEPNPLYTWRKWEDVVQPYAGNVKTAFFDMVVPTVDTVRYVREPLPPPARARLRSERKKELAAHQRQRPTSFSASIAAPNLLLCFFCARFARPLTPRSGTRAL